MKIGAIDRITNKMVYFNTLDELTKFRSEQDKQLAKSKEVVAVVDSVTPRRFIFSITVEAADEVDATLACESILLKAYDTDVANFMRVMDVKEITAKKE